MLVIAGVCLASFPGNEGTGIFSEVHCPLFPSYRRDDAVSRKESRHIPLQKLQSILIFLRLRSNWK